MTASEPAIRAFRDALGNFATGVTIATTVDAHGGPVGVTASSFNSVSLSPPMVLWSLAKDSSSLPAFSQSGHFAVHVLAASQEELSNRFARTGKNKFSGLDWREGSLGSPVFDTYAARFECSTRHQYEGGDHIILVGEVIEFEARDEAPLLFHGGRYAEHRPKPMRELPYADGSSKDDAQILALLERGLVRPTGGSYALSERGRACIAEAQALIHAFEDRLGDAETGREADRARTLLRKVMDMSDSDES